MMIVEKFWNVPVSMRLAILTVATYVVPLGVVDAQEFDAVERRLGGAVESGEITLEQAKLMMDALRRSTGSRQMEAQKHRYMQLAGEIEAAVAAGKISMEEAKEKISEVRREMFAEVDGEMDAKKRRYMEYLEEMKAAVNAGKLTKEEAIEKTIAVRREMSEEIGEHDGRVDMEAKKRRYMEYLEEIKAAVDAGKISEVEAEEKTIAVRREMLKEIGKDDGGNDMEAKKRRYMEYVEEIKAAVDAGKISEVEAEEKIVAVRREMLRETGEDDGGDDMEAKKRCYMKFAEEIDAALKAGKLSQEEAEQRLIKLRKKLFKVQATKQ